MSRATFVTGAGVLATAIVAFALLPASGALVALAVLAAVAAVALAGSEAMIRARARGQGGTLSHQLIIALALVTGPLLVTLAGLGLFMFVSGHDAALVGVIVAFTGCVGIEVTHRLAAPIITDVRAVRDGLEAVGHGERQSRLPATSGDELAELARAANVMIDRLSAEEAARDQADAARRSLIAAASHDLRTPLTSLRLLAQAIDDGVVDGATRREYVGRMLVHVDALGALVDDLFELSRLEAGDINWTVERVALGDLVTDTIDALRVHADAKGIAVSARVTDGVLAARVNPEKLQRVLFNLIQNAIRHTPSDGSVMVHVQPASDAIEVEVADTGDGIAPEERPRIFEAFYRGGDSSRSGTGAGLGLAIARAIVEAHGGRIWLADSVQGTRVRFTVPAA